MHMKILIIGLRSGSSNDISKLFKSLNITYLPSDKLNGKRLNDLDNYDYVINVTRFSKHLVQHKCKHHDGFIRLLPSQGLSTVKQTLHTLSGV